MNRIADWKYTKSLYNEKSAWPPKNMWHEYTYLQIKKYIETKYIEYVKSSSKILNIGSGGTTYNIKGTFYHLDIAEQLIQNLKNSFVGNAEDMPFENGFFDNIICVGSVINYCNAMSVISESYRTLKPACYMVLEFERSNSGEFLLTNNYNKSVFPKWYEYNNQNHMLWMYSEKYILSLLKAYNFEIIDIHRFHNLSALSNRFIELKDDILAPVIKKDKYFKCLSRFIAHNTILIAKKH